MPQKKITNDSSDCKDFYQSMTPSLRSYYSMSSTDLSREDLERGYPIQSHLKTVEIRYSRPELIGSGALKDIFKVFDKKSATSVAMAKLKKNAGHESVEAFLREARLSASLQHPNIVAIYDMGFDEKQSPYFTMELLGGENLEAGIKNGAYTQERLIDIFLKVCDAVAYAHHKEIIHLDLKPGNIQVGNFGEVHVCDWGLGKVINSDEDFGFDEDLDPNILNHATMSGHIKGTPGYMAPEQACADSNKDARTDTYALGAILYTIYTGLAPIQGDTTEELIRKTKESLVSPISTELDIRKGLQAIINRSLELNPDQRYQTVTELKADLHKHLQGFATTAEEAGLLTQLYLFAQRHKKALAISMLFCISFAGVIIAAFQKVNHERKNAISARNIAVTNLQLLKEEQALTEELKLEINLLFDEISRSDNLDSAQRKVSLLERGLELETNKKEKQRIRKKIALLYFVLEDFVAAENTFKQLNVKSSLKTACKWAIQTKGDRDQLSHRELAQLFKKINSPKNYALMTTMYIRHMNSQQMSEIAPKDYFPLANVMLNIVNNLWGAHENNTLPHLKNGVLKLPAKPYQRFSLINKLNILKPLHLTELDISHTGFFEFTQLNGLNLKKLNIAGCKVNKINEARISMLKKSVANHITYDSNYLSSDEVKLLQDNFSTNDLSKK
jgi:tRNA A-37 threonylcarbamoyl transferase component Bud32